ncbi:MAG: aminoacyl-tRNA hydrolase [Alphaproteobacteria bacterium]|nr:aminoacyl-tRNA hydrolase [Alphaproteobacteria bacterium]MDE1967955.1 aminoacyl-tRNA hydrolase [Alphaproteobacteria bacterium]MDE2512558.1 aminoacyl-tRNA hydrolase [Alphaproteobacteria bacterium]
MKASRRIRQIPVAIDESAVDEDFILASGPGGQAVQKQSTAVKLHYDLNCAAGIDDHMRRRLKTVAGKRLRRDGVLVITAQRFRSQERNRADARARLTELLRRAAFKAKPRLPVGPTLAAVRKRVEDKRVHGRLKRLRHVAPGDE